MRSLLSTILAFSLLLGAFGCTSRKDEFQTKLRDAISITNEGEHAIVDVERLTSFKWDRLIIFGPYTPVSNIQNSLGYEWKEASRTGIDLSDTFNLFVFTEKGKVVQHFNTSRAILDFNSHNRSNTLVPGKATFDVTIISSRKVVQSNRD